MDAKETALYTAILITGVTIGIVFLFFVISIMRQQRRSQALYKRSIVAEINTLETERRRMAADLHDELGPVVAAIKYLAGSLDPTPEDEETVERINVHIDGLVQMMQDIANDLVPSALSRKGMIIAIEDLIRSIPSSQHVKIQFWHDDVTSFSPDQAIHLYRIIAEIVHNTLKHAEASMLDISLRSSDGRIVLRTEDNGKGFHFERLRMETKGYGLQNLLHRAELLGGDLFVESVVGKGTIFQLEIKGL